MAHKIGLRVAIIWRGTVLQERMFSAEKGERVVFSGDTSKKHVMVIPDFDSDVEALIPEGDGYNVRFPENATGSITRDGEEKTLADIRKDARQCGTVQTVEGSQKLHVVHVKEGDWGLITINEVTIYFQLRNAAIAVPISAFDLPIQAPLAASILISGILHATFLMLVMLAPEQDPALREMRIQDRFASFLVEDVKAPIEEEEVPPDEPVEQSTSGKKAGGEEGKFGKEDSEFEDSKLPNNDGEMKDKIDVKNIGINKALSSNVLGSGALKNVFGNSNGIEATMNVAMAGEGGTLQVGRGNGGMGFRGTGSGGGGEGVGRIGGLGKVDTGGGKGTGAKIGRKRTEKAKPKMATGTPNLGDFCDKNNIRRVVNAKNNAIRYCFEHELQTNPSLNGKIIASWQVGLDGSVMNASIASSTINNKNVEGCVTRIIKTMRFQKPDGGICVIKFPFVFTGIE